MKVKIEKAFAWIPALSVLMDKKLGVKGSYRLTRIVKKVNAEIESANKVRNDLINEYKDEGSDPASVSQENPRWDEFAGKMKALMDEEFDLPFDPIPIEMLGDIEVEPAIFAALDDLFVE